MSATTAGNCGLYKLCWIHWVMVEL